MITLTAEQFKKKYGEQGVQAFGQPAQSNQQPGFLERAKTSLVDSGNEIKRALSSGGGISSNIRGGTEAAFGVFNAPIKVASEIPGIKQATELIGKGVSKVVNPLTEAISNNPSLQKWTMDHPQAFKELTNALGTASAAGGIAGDILAYNAVGQGVSKVADKLSSAKDVFGSGKVGALKERISASVNDYDPIVRSGEMTPEQVFKDVNQKIFQPDVAKTRISDIGAKLDKFNKDLGSTFRKSVTIDTPADTMVQTAFDLLDKTPTGLSAVSSAVSNTVKDVVSKAQQLVKTGGEKLAESVSPIDAGVKTILERPGVSPKLIEYAKQGEQRMIDYSKPSPMELAGDKAKGALKTINEKLQKIGGSKGELTTKIGNTIDAKPAVSKAVDTLRDGLNKFGVSLKQTSDGAIKFVRSAGREITLPVSDLKNIKSFVEKLNSLKNTGFQRVDDTIDFLQNELYAKTGAKLTVPVNKQAEGLLKKVLGDMNSELKSIAEKAGYLEYSNLNTQYRNLITVRNVLNKALGEGGNKGAALMKQLFSPSGTASRKLFEAVKTITGVDLVEEATLAKFVMENIGDARQSSLLEEIIKLRNPKSFIASQAERILKNKIGTALDRAKDIAK